MANFWENDPVVNAPAGDIPAPPGPLRINIGKQPQNVAHETSTDSDMVRAAAAGGATGPLLGLGGVTTDLPQLLMKGAATLGSKGASLLAHMVGASDLADKIAPGGATPYPAVDFLEKAYANNRPMADMGSANLRSKAAAVDNSIHGPGYQSPFTYQPQDPREQLAYNVLSGATADPVAPVAGALGAGVSTMAGDAFKGTPLEVPAQVIGGMMGAGAPTAANRYLPRTSAEGLIQKMTAGVTPQQFNAAEDLQADAQRIGVPLTGAEAMQQAVGQQGRLGTLQRTLENNPASEPAFRPMMAQRPAAVDSAGRALLENTFGDLKTPELAANRGAEAAKGAIGKAIAERTEAARPAFEATEGQKVSALEGLDELKGLVDKEIENAGTITAKGKALQEFRKQLDQGAPPPSTAVQQQLQAAGVKLGTPAWDQAMKQMIPGEPPQQPLGPLMNTNREFARRLQQRYNPSLPAEQQTGFAAEIGAKLGPLNGKLTDLLKGASPDYGRGLDLHAANSPAVNRLTNGATGRIAGLDEGDVGARLGQQANELLGPETRPAEIRQTINDLVTGERANAEAATVRQGFKKGSPEFDSAMKGWEPTAAKQVVGAHLENLFNTSTKALQSGPNPFGGAKFANAVMGNPQMAENLQTTVESLSGKQAWPGVKRFMDVMQATGKRKAAGSETQMNMAQQAELNQASGAVNFLAKGMNPLEWGKAAGDFVDGWTANANAKQLAEVLTHPQAVAKMREMALWAPNSAKAKLLAAQAIQLANPSVNNSAQDNGTRGTTPVTQPAPAAPASSPQEHPSWMPPETDTLYAPAAGGPVSALDRDSAIRTMYGEAAGEGPDGQAAVAHVILNRTKSGKFGESIRDVVMAPHQFEPWNDRQARARIEHLRADSPVYQQLGEIFDKAAEGQLPDNTKGATHFLAAQMQRAMGRKIPDWARKDTQLAQIGGHTFYAP